MTPTVQRAILVLAGAACVVASFVVPQSSQYLLPTGVGLLAWAKTAPGDTKAAS